MCSAQNELNHPLISAGMKQSKESESRAHETEMLPTGLEWRLDSEAPHSQISLHDGERRTENLESMHQPEGTRSTYPHSLRDFLQDELQVQTFTQIPPTPTLFSGENRPLSMCACGAWRCFQGKQLELVFPSIFQGQLPRYLQEIMGFVLFLVFLPWMENNVHVESLKTQNGSEKEKSQNPKICGGKSF